MQDKLSALPDRSVLLSAQELAETVGTTLTDEREATAALQALFASAGSDADVAGALAATDVDAARRVLDLALHDADTAGQARAILEDPPADEQMSVEAAVVAAVVLGAVVSWLQTKVDITISRRDGKTEFEFALRKSAASQQTLQRLAEIVAGVLGLRPSGGQERPAALPQDEA